jgi:hypothetical protein
MRYRRNKLRLSHFYRYIQRLFGFQQAIQSLQDDRQDPEVKTQSLFEALMLGFVLHQKSFRALGFEIKQGRAKKVMRHGEVFSVNTLRYGLEFFQIEPLKGMLESICRKMKRSKMLSESVGGLKVAALDGTEYYRSQAIHCPQCLQVHLRDGTVQYVHRAVFLQYVGTKLKPFLAAEPIRPKDPQPGDKQAGHEGELTAAKRLLREVTQHYGPDFITLLTLDALYMNQPFVRQCQACGYEAVIRVKNERTELYQEIQALSQWVKPLEDYAPQEGVAYTIYEIPDLHLSVGWEIPLRGFKIIETSSSRGTQSFLCATTSMHLKADRIRQVVHLKWGIENNGYKDLKDNWHLEHNFHHHAVATWVIVLTMLIAYNLFYAYVYRNLKTYRLYGLSLQQIVDELKYSFFSLRYKLSWSLWAEAP